VHKFLQILLLVVLIFCFISCKPPSGGSQDIIRIKGSFTMYELTNALASAYMDTHPGISVYVEGGGTSTGFKGLEEGNIDIAMASRLIRPEEARSLAEKYGKLGISFLVAKDALSVYVNSENPVSNFSIEELKSVFTGFYYNWRQVGGMDAPIQVVLRPPSSGTYVYFNDFVLENMDYTDKAITIPTNTALFEYIHDNNNAIGFAGIYSPGGVKKCLINGVSPIEDNVINDTYPLIRYLYFYTLDKPSGVYKEFIEWVLSKEGQKIVKRIGFIPLWLK